MRSIDRAPAWARRVAATAGALALLLAPLAPALAQGPHQFTVVNTTAVTADDLHVTLRGTGGSLFDPSIVIDAPGCVATPGRAMAAGNRVDVMWPAACVVPGSQVTIQVSTEHGPIDVVDATWTLDGVAVPPPPPPPPPPPLPPGPRDEAVTIRNGTKHRADDLHVVFAGTGGTLRNARVTADAPGCGSTPGRAVASGNTVTVTWGAPCVDPLESIALTVTSDFGADLDSRHWTRAGVRLPEFIGGFGKGGRWSLAQGAPLLWCFVDPSPGGAHPSKPWTAAEKAVVRAALAEFAQKAQQFPIFEGWNIDSECDVTMRWEDGSLFKEWAVDSNFANLAGWCNIHPDRFGDPNVQPQRDFPPVEIYLRETLPSSSWFVDPTPTEDEEFDQGKARRGSAAEGKLDLYYVMLHEFSHCYGLTHTDAGPDNVYGTPDDVAPDQLEDNGELMFPFGRRGERRRGLPVGPATASQRRHVDAAAFAVTELWFGAAADNDQDNDGVPAAADNCTFVANRAQGDEDGDGIGDACDVDGDNDSWIDRDDNCPGVPNVSQGDFDRDGTGDACEPHDGVGLHDPATGMWYLRDPATARTRSFFYGNPGDVPVVGDWDCDGVATPGLLRPADGFAYLRNSNAPGLADVAYFFGDPGDVPLAGDFDGDGCDTISLYRPSEQRVYIANRLGSHGTGLGAADAAYTLGNPGDRPFTGDFDGDGVDTLGSFRPPKATVFVRNQIAAGAADVVFGFGEGGDRIVAGDWQGSGVDTPAAFRPEAARFFVRFELSSGSAQQDFYFGEPGWTPLAGAFGLSP